MYEGLENVRQVTMDWIKKQFGFCIASHIFFVYIYMENE